MPNKIYLTANEFNETLKSLEVVADFLPKVISDNYHWRWIVISLHNAVQGLMVCALKGGGGLNVLKDDVKDQWLQAYRNNSGDYPVEILDSYLNLYKKVKSEKMVIYCQSIKFVPQGQQGWSIKKLNRLRNKFIHFLPGGLLLEVSGLPNISIDCISLIDFLVFESGNIWPDRKTQINIRHLIDKIMKEIYKIKKVYET